MAPKSDEQPFLKYTDDEALGHDDAPASCNQNGGATKRRPKFLTPVVSHTLVFVLTSILWIFIHQAASYARSAPPSSPATTNTPPLSAVHHPGGGAHSHTGHDEVATLPPSHGAAAVHNATSDRRLLDCGSSTAEAKARGCKYDILLNHYVAPQCLEPEWIEEYKDDETWHGYLDQARTRRIDGGAEAMGDVDHYWTSTRDHVNHCVQLWRRQFIALFEGRSIDTVSASWGHTEHCSQFLLDVTDRVKEYYTEPILVEVGWAGCWVKDGPK